MLDTLKHNTAATALVAMATGLLGIRWMRWHTHSRRRMVIIGSRDSPLAMYQANEVKSKLEKAHGKQFRFRILNMSTFGDNELSKPLAALACANPGLFTTELETRLVKKEFDIVVHSLKDMPTTLPPGLVLASITEREAPEDVLLVHRKHRGCGGLANLPDGAIIGTSSVRRKSIILRNYPTLDVQSIRGNLQTRLTKLDNPTESNVIYDAIVLAKAGVTRLGWSNRIEATLLPDTFPYGVGQGSLGIECRSDDQVIHQLVNADTVQHMPSALRCVAERAVMRTLQGGCQMAMGVSSTLSHKGMLSLYVIVLSEDGQQTVQATQHRSVATIDDANYMGIDTARELKDLGAMQLLDTTSVAPRQLTYGNA